MKLTGDVADRPARVVSSAVLGLSFGAPARCHTLEMVPGFMESPNTRLAGTLGLRESKSFPHSTSLQGEDLHRPVAGRRLTPSAQFQHSLPATLWVFASGEVVLSEAQFPHL